MWRALADGRIDYLSSDHAPSTLEQKREGSIWDVHFGLPGIDTTLSVLLDGAHAGRIPYERVAEVYSEGPRGSTGCGPARGASRRAPTPTWSSSTPRSAGRFATRTSFAGGVVAVRRHDSGRPRAPHGAARAGGRGRRGRARRAGRRSVSRGRHGPGRRRGSVSAKTGRRVRGRGGGPGRQLPAEAVRTAGCRPPLAAERQRVADAPVVLKLRAGPGVARPCRPRPAKGWPRGLPAAQRAALLGRDPDSGGELGSCSAALAVPAAMCWRRAGDTRRPASPTSRGSGSGHVLISLPVGCHLRYPRANSLT